MKTRYIKNIVMGVLLSSSLAVQAQTDNNELNNALKFLYDNMVYIEGGTYLKGENKVSTAVQSFYCCRYETTRGLYRLVTELPKDEDDDMTAVMGPDWNQVQEFIAKLNALTGKNYRLLTDDEWEYAARGGNQSKGYLYSGSNNIHDVAWYIENLPDALPLVGTKQPNELGLYDMSGNAEEWCQDYIEEQLAKRRTPIVDVDSLPDPPDWGEDKFVRGGSLISDAEECTVYAHYGQPSGWGMPTIGFRLALDASEYEGPKAPKFRIGLKADAANSEIDHDANYIEYNPQTKKFILPPKDEESGGIATELDIAQVDYISRSPVSTVRLPEEAAVSVSDITILADGNDVEVAEDGTFTTEAQTVSAFGKDNRLIYFSYASFEEGKAAHEVKLNALETAVSLLLPAFPNALFIASNDVAEKLKQLLRDLDVTKQLASAIDKSVAQKGYLDYNLIISEFNTAVNHLTELMTKGAQSRQYAHINNRIAPVKPVVPAMSEDARMSFILDDSKWVYGYNPYTSNSQWYWDCTFDVTSIRFAPMALLLGHIDRTDGTIVNYPYENEIDVLNNIIPPYTSKAIYERLTTIEGLYEQLQLITLGDDHLHLFDEVLEKGVKLNFYNKDDIIMVMGPTTDPYLLLYYMLNGVVCPVIKILGGEMGKYYDKKYSEEKYDLNFDGISSRYKSFVISMVKELAKAKAITKVVDIVNSNKTRSTKVKEITEIIKPIIFDKIKKDMNEAVKGTGKSLFFDFLSSELDRKVKNFEKFYKAETKDLEVLFTCVDFFLNSLGILEDPVSVLELELDFNVPEAGLDDIPGHRF